MGDDKDNKGKKADNNELVDLEHNDKSAKIDRYDESLAIIETADSILIAGGISCKASSSPSSAN